MNQATAIVTAYNASRFLPRCLESILSQTFPRIQIIVVDDHSTDDTATVAASYGDKVKVIRLTSNRGPATGRTTGLMAAKTKYVTFLDSDDYWHPDFVNTTVEFLNRNREVVAVTTGYCAHSWNGERYYGPNLDKDDRQYYGQDGAVCPNYYAFWSKYRSVRTGSVMMRNEIAHKTGGQREDLRQTEDLEYWAYLATFGHWGFIPHHLLITDQRIITPRERLNKLKKRSDSFRNMTVDTWTNRISPRLRDPVSIQEYSYLIGHIATEIALANAYTFNIRKSYSLSRQWREHLDGGLGIALKWGLFGGLMLWPGICLLLRVRETVKTLLMPVRLTLKRKLF